MKSSKPLSSSMKESVRPLVASGALASWTSFADSRMEPVARENALSSRAVADSAQRAIDSEIDVAALVISHMRSRRNALSPIFVLPEDVLALIFEHVSRSHPFFSPPLLESWLSITFVCRVWRQIALSHPCLWRDIPIGPHPKWAELFLERSKATPIVFLVLPPFSEYPIVFEFMQNHLWHTDAIYFEGHVSEVERLAQIIASGAPILEALNLKVTDVGYTRQGTQIVSASVIKSAPKLHTLRIANTPLLSWNILPWANLKCLEIESSNIPDLPTLLRGLGSALQLEDLKFTDLERIPQFVGNEGIQNAKLERLKSLVIGGTLEDCVTLWNVLDVPATVSLHILVTLSRTGQYRANAVVPLLRKHLDRAISARLPPIQVLQIKETRSVGLPLDGISFTAWRSVGSASDPFAPPEDCPRIKLDLFNTSYSNAQWCLQDVQTLCRIIQFDGLHALSVSLRKESWQKKSWVSIFGSAKHLQDLEVHGRAAYSLAKALVPTIQNVPDENMPQPGPSSARGRGRGRGGKNQKVKRTQVHGPIFLPELRSLRFKTVRFDVNYEGKAFCKKLPTWIKQRLASPGNKVATLELRDCVVQEQNVADLRRIQGLQLEWDGREGEPDMDHIIPHEVYQDSIYDELDYLDDGYMGYYDDTWQGHDFDDFDDSLYYHQY